MVWCLLRNLRHNLQKIGYLIKTHYRSNRTGKEEDGSFLTRKWSITDSNDVKKINGFLIFAFPRLIDWYHFFSSTCACTPQLMVRAPRFPLNLFPLWCHHSLQLHPQSACSEHPEPRRQLGTPSFAFSPCLLSFYTWQEQIPAQLSMTHILPGIPHCYSHKAFQNLNYKVSATVGKWKDSITNYTHFLQHFKPLVGMEVFHMLPAVVRGKTGDHEMVFVQQEQKELKKLIWFYVKSNKKTSKHNKAQVNLLQLERLEILEKLYKRLIE